MSQGQGWDVFTKWDGYAQGVNLLYKKKPRFQTPCGGICTIISLMLALYWALTSIIGVFIPPGIYNEQSKIDLFSVDIETGLYEPIQLYEKDMYVAYKFVQQGVRKIADEDLEKIVTGMWFQYKHDLDEPIPYTPIDCLEVPFIAESDEYVRH